MKETHKPLSIDKLSSIVKDLYNSKTRYCIVYSYKNTQNDFSKDVQIISLENLTHIAPVDKLNSKLKFTAGTRIKYIIDLLNSNGYSDFPFSKFPIDTPVGYYFTHTRIFDTSNLYNLTIMMPNGDLIKVGHNTFTSVAGYNSLEIFLGTKNIIGIPLEYSIKITSGKYSLNHNENIPEHKQHYSFTEHELKFIYTLKNIYDPINLLNTRAKIEK